MPRAQWSSFVLCQNILQLVKGYTSSPVQHYCSHHCRWPCCYAFQAHEPNGAEFLMASQPVNHRIEGYRLACAASPEYRLEVHATAGGADCIRMEQPNSSAQSTSRKGGSKHWDGIEMLVHSIYLELAWREAENDNVKDTRVTAQLADHSCLSLQRPLHPAAFLRKSVYP